MLFAESFRPGHRVDGEMTPEPRSARGALTQEPHGRVQRRLKFDPEAVLVFTADHIVSGVARAQSNLLLFLPRTWVSSGLGGAESRFKGAPRRTIFTLFVYPTR